MKLQLCCLCLGLGFMLYLFLLRESTVWEAQESYLLKLWVWLNVQVSHFCFFFRLFISVLLFLLHLKTFPSRMTHFFWGFFFFSLWTSLFFLGQLPLLC